MSPGTGKFGVHLMLDGYGADPARLSDRVRLTSLLDGLPALLDMHAIAPAQVVEVGPNNRKDPGGLSGFVMIAESHISFHTFPARGFVTIDLYTCRDTIDRARVVALLTDAFAIASLDVFAQDRGLRYPMADLSGHRCPQLAPCGSR
jgi:S-adenosylmethionine decarboxylase